MLLGTLEGTTRGPIPARLGFASVATKISLSLDIVISLAVWRAHSGTQNTCPNTCMLNLGRLHSAYTAL